MKLLTTSLVMLLAFLSGCQKNDEPLVAQPPSLAFSINGEAVQLNTDMGNGIVSIVNTAMGDMNKDGLDDRAVVLKHNSDGSGTFYYLNVFLSSSEGDWRLAGEEFLGDRIKFDYVEVYTPGSMIPGTSIANHPDDYGTLVVAFYVHLNQPFAESPIFYSTRHWVVINDKLMARSNN